MNTLKPFYVELTYTGVVMAANSLDAELVAERHATKIASDSGDPSIDCSVELRSVAHLKRLDSGWDANCYVYGSDESIGELLPAEGPPERDTKTIDMFSSQEGWADT